MNPALFQRAFPVLPLNAGSSSQITTPLSPAFAAMQRNKSFWPPSPVPLTPSPIGFPGGPIWPHFGGAFAPWTHHPFPAFPYPLFSMTDLDSLLYGFMRRADDPQRGLALSSVQMGGPTVPRTGHHFPGPHDRRGQHEHSTANILAEPSDLPSELTLSHAFVFGVPQYGVFAKSEIAKGTRYGPYRGKIVQTSEIKANDNCSSMWEVFDDGKLSHYIDGRTQNGVAGWMSLVQTARSLGEQNMEVLQQDGEIYYQAIRDIAAHSELLVWYGESYDSHLGIPTVLPTAKKTSSKKADHLPVESLELVGNGFSCERCGKMFTYKYYLDKHLKFTRCVDMGDRGYPCPICDRSFEKRDRLRIHILHVHEKYKPHVCAACGKAFSQSSSLNKHIRVHTGQRPYKCVHCAKTFTASSILRTHIRQHSGEKPFKCKFCGKSFASHAAHDSHVRRSHLTTTASAASRRATPTTTTTTAATTPNSYNAEDEDEDDPEVEMLLGDHRHRPEEENDLNDDDDEETDKTLVDV